MNPLIHFLASIVVGIGVGLHHKRKYTIILVLASLCLFVDLDHLIGGPKADSYMFHNVFVFITLPLTIFLVCYLYEVVKREGSTKYQRISLVFIVMLVGHMFLDGIDGGAMALYYPLSSNQYVLSDISFEPHPYVSLSSEQTLLLIWGLIILATNLIETRIYKRHEGFYDDIFTYLEYPKRNRWTRKLKMLMRRTFRKRDGLSDDPYVFENEDLGDV